MQAQPQARTFKRVKATEDAKAALEAWKNERNTPGDPAKTLEKLKKAKEKMFAILNQYDDTYSSKIVSIPTLLSLYKEKKQFAEAHQAEKGETYSIPSNLKRVGKVDKDHFKGLQWEDKYEKWQIFHLYYVVTKRLFNTLVSMTYEKGTNDLKWKNAAKDVVRLKKRLWAEMLTIKMQRMSGSKNPSQAPAESKKKRRRGRGKNKAPAEGAGEGGGAARGRAPPAEGGAARPSGGKKSSKNDGKGGRGRSQSKPPYVFPESYNESNRDAAGRYVPMRN